MKNKSFYEIRKNINFNNGEPLTTQKEDVRQQWIPVHDDNPRHRNEWIHVGTNRQEDILCVTNSECCGGVCKTPRIK